MTNKLLRFTSALIVVSLLAPALVSAHVAVKPAQVSPGEFQTFTMGVPNEKNIAVEKIRLLIPAGLQHVTPNVKPGWEIEVEKTAITWSRGIIPAGQRDDFSFSVQIPADEGILIWKAYQTYADGTTSTWDQAPTSQDISNDENTGPYPKSIITDDQLAESAGTSQATTLGIAVVALILSLVALTRPLSKTRNS